MSDIQLLESLQTFSKQLKSELAKTIVGQSQTIDTLLTGLLCGGHCLLTGVPGLAKTLLVRSLAQTLSFSFSRIQFTPDLMPSDITGTEIIQQDPGTGERRLTFQPGPIFANLILADEINRTPPKTQAALLEAMQEGQITVGNQTRPLPKPFFVLATQNPLEQSGTYPLPEAQLDRFMFNIPLDYPSAEEELSIILNCQPGSAPELSALIDAKRLSAYQDLIRRIPVDEQTARYALSLVRRSRPRSQESQRQESQIQDTKRQGTGESVTSGKAKRSPVGRFFSSPQESSSIQPDISDDFINQYVRWGAGPRAGQYLLLGAKCRAALSGRNHPLPEDVAFVARLVLRHRILLNFHAEAQGITADQIVAHLISGTFGASPS